jgi:hypothetical protein
VCLQVQLADRMSWCCVAVRMQPQVVRAASAAEGSALPTMHAAQHHALSHAPHLVIVGSTVLLTAAWSLCIGWWHFAPIILLHSSIGYFTKTLLQHTGLLPPTCDWRPAGLTGETAQLLKKLLPV